MIDRHPITQSRKAFLIVGTSIDAIANVDSNQDESVQTLEVLTAVQKVAMVVLGNTPDLTKLREELTDYTEDEKAELVQILANSTLFDSNKVETLFDRALALVLDIIDFVVDTGRPDEDFEPAPQEE